MTDQQTLRTRIEHARSEPPPRGHRLFRPLDDLMARLDGAVESVVPPQYNPFAQTGALTVVTFLVSAVSGILLLFWYRPSVHLAYESVLAMEASIIGSFLRNLHRYSSDACLFFAVVHALRLLFAGRFTRARWLAWVSGVVMVGVLWVCGWLGYMLVWDTPAQLVAVNTAAFLDVLPIFSEPISRAFLADELVPSLLFFVVFFAHMLLPLLIVAGIWIHVARMQRPKLITSRWMSVWTVAALVLLSLVVPASAQAPADLTTDPSAMTIDAWYLAPLWLADRLQAGLLWAVAVGTTALLVGIPWILSRSETDDDTATATLRTEVCNGCTLCARDCPYDAIVMVPRKDDRRYELQAELDPSRCVGCGICAGSCNPGGIGLSWLPIRNMRKRFDNWIDEFIEQSADDEGPVLAFMCAESAAARFRVNSETGECPELPGFRVVGVPCSGWVQPLTVERALRRGAAGVMVVGCRESDPQYREGDEWTGRRMAGTRKPALRTEHVDTERVRHVSFDRTRPDELLAEAERFRRHVRGEDPEDESPPKNQSYFPGRMFAAGVALAALLSAIVAFGSHVPYPGPPESPPQLVVSVHHYAEQVEECRTVSEDDSDRPVHMQQDEICERGRADLVVEVDVDGETIHRDTVSPRGIHSDGPAVTLDYLNVDPGTRRVTVRISDDDNEEVWNFQRDFQLHFEESKRQVVLFDTHDGFRHAGADDGGSS